MSTPNTMNSPSAPQAVDKSQPQRILLVGASGVLGQAVQRHLGERHEILSAGRESGQYRVDLRSEASVEALLRELGPLDAVVSTAGGLHFGPLTRMTAAQFDSGLQDKLLGQVRLALAAQHVLRDGGSITLTAGVLSREPIPMGANASAVNAALEAFALAAAIELPRGLRINVVSPTVLTESLPKYGAFMAGMESASAARVALAYQRSVEGGLTGRTFSVV